MVEYEEDRLTATTPRRQVGTYGKARRVRLLLQVRTAQRTAERRRLGEPTLRQLAEEWYRRTLIYCDYERRRNVLLANAISAEDLTQEAWTRIAKYYDHPSFGWAPPSRLEGAADLRTWLIMICKATASNILKHRKVARKLGVDLDQGSSIVAPSTPQRVAFDINNVGDRQPAWQKRMMANLPPGPYECRICHTPGTKEHVRPELPSTPGGTVESALCLDCGNQRHDTVKSRAFTFRASIHASHSPAMEAERSERKDMLLAAMRGLERFEHAILWAAFAEEKTDSEIADALTEAWQHQTGKKHEKWMRMSRKMRAMYVCRRRQEALHKLRVQMATLHATPAEVLGLPVSILGLPPREVNVLRRAGITKVQDAIRSLPAMVQMEGVGIGVAAKVRRGLRRFGLEAK